ncbi:CoA pyrophosphatase [Cryomorphaceae bacterium 1068]|nr:CoA pyrophosphatase [Cryomorphaceae bacterium 1068]
MEKPLPGWDAHSKMINYIRPSAIDVEKVDPEARHGAVLALIYPVDNIPHVALMLRNTYEGTHSGQVSFPGGKREQIDKDLIQTALREAHEEMNIRPEEVTVVGPLSKVYIPPSRFLVAPFVGYSQKRPNFKRDPLEVAEIIEAPLHIILEESSIKQKPIFVQVTNSELEVKYFDILGHTVWGATAMMLKELAEILTE